MVCSMAFDRKWVSDSNLDKLWNETIEKKEANKQRRSPDFCKEAILSATLKRISSEMLMRQFASPSVDIDIDSDDDDDDDDDDNTIQVLTNLSTVTEKEFEDINIDANDPSLSHGSNCSDFICHSMQLSSIDDISDFESVSRSPKRRWSDTEGDDVGPLNSSAPCSPAKRTKPESSEEMSCVSPARRKRSQSPARSGCSGETLMKVQRHLNLPKVKIIPADNEASPPPKTQLNTSLLSPVRSVVNSISELSIAVNSPIRSNESEPWCINLAPEPIHSDPLELDGFFNNLRKVTS